MSEAPVPLKDLQMMQASAEHISAVIAEFSELDGLTDTERNALHSAKAHAERIRKRILSALK